MPALLLAASALALATLFASEARRERRAAARRAEQATRPHSVDTITPDDLDALYTRIFELERQAAIDISVMEKADRDWNELVDASRKFKAWGEEQQEWGEQQRARANRYRAAIDRVQTLAKRLAKSEHRGLPGIPRPVISRMLFETLDGAEQDVTSPQAAIDRVETLLATGPIGTCCDHLVRAALVQPKEDRS